MTRPPQTPRTEAGRELAARAKRQGWSNWEGLAQFTIPAIEAEARRQERKRVVEQITSRLNDAAISMRGWQDRDYRYIAEYRAATILDEVGRDTEDGDE